MPVDKIKRSFTWLRKSLGIIDKTTLPGDVNGEVRVAMDLFGWDRLQQPAVHQNSGTAAATTVNGLICPADVLRLVLQGDVHHNDVVDRTIWMEKVTPASSVALGIVVPRDLGSLEPNPLERWVFLVEGERLRARADAMGAGMVLSLTISIIDLPVGEYIAPL